MNLVKRLSKTGNTIIVFIICMILSLTACGKQQETEVTTVNESEMHENDTVETTETKEEPMTTNTETTNIIKLFIDDKKIDVIWEDNESVEGLREKVQEKDVEVAMSMYGGFEQVGPLGFTLPRNDIQMTTNAGDIVLYSGNQIVMFYGSNSWAYTKLGKIQASQEELESLLGNKDVKVKLSIND